MVFTMVFASSAGASPVLPRALPVGPEALGVVVLVAPGEGRGRGGGGGADARLVLQLV